MADRESLRRVSPIAWCYLAAFCAVSPFVFVLVQSYVARLIVPTLLTLGVASGIELRVVVFGMKVLGALLAAAILCIPLGWLARGSATFFGALVGLIGGLVVSWMGRSVPPDGVALWALRILEVAAFVAGCILFAIAGARSTHRVAA